MRKTISSLLSDLNQKEQIYFRLSPEKHDAFYEDCRSAGITKFLSGKQFHREDVRGLMGVRSDRTIGYVSALCFSAAIAGNASVDETGNEEKILLIDYDRMLQGEDGIIQTETGGLHNGRPLNGKIVTIGSHSSVRDE